MKRIRCVECDAMLSRYSGDFLCCVHRYYRDEIKRYVLKREVQAAGMDRWARCQCEKQRLREPYIRLLSKKGVIPWSATWSEVKIIDPVGFQEVANVVKPTKELTRGVVLYLERHFPETNLLTEWHYAMEGKRYERFAADE